MYHINGIHWNSKTNKQTQLEFLLSYYHFIMWSNKSFHTISNHRIQSSAPFHNTTHSNPLGHTICISVKKISFHFIQFHPHIPQFLLFRELFRNCVLPLNSKDVITTRLTFFNLSLWMRKICFVFLLIAVMASAIDTSTKDELNRKVKAELGLLTRSSPICTMALILWTTRMLLTCGSTLIPMMILAGL